MTDFMNRRSISFLLFGLLFIWQVTPLFFPRIPYFARGGSLGMVRSAYALPAMPSLKMKSIPVPTDPVVVIHKAQYINGVALHSNALPYVGLFIGKVSCGELTCQHVHLRLHMETTHVGYIDKNIELAEDGTYRLEVPFKETPQEHLDYTLTAFRDQEVSQELHGRQILTEDASVDIENEIHLN